MKKFYDMLQVQEYCEELIEKDEIVNYYIVSSVNNLTILLNEMFEQFIQEMETYNKTRIETVLVENENIKQFVYIVSNEFVGFDELAEYMKDIFK